MTSSSGRAPSEPLGWLGREGQAAEPRAEALLRTRRKASGHLTRKGGQEERQQLLLLPATELLADQAGMAVRLW